VILDYNEHTEVAGVDNAFLPGFISSSAFRFQEKGAAENLVLARRART